MLNVKESDWEHEKTGEISVTNNDVQQKKEQARTRENRQDNGDEKRRKEHGQIN